MIAPDRLATATPGAEVADAVRSAAPIAYRPERFVANLLAEYEHMPLADVPDDETLRRHWYNLPIRMGGTRAVFRLRAGHWPMLNLLAGAERQRRAFADAMTAAVAAIRAARAAPR